MIVRLALLLILVTLYTVSMPPTAAPQTSSAEQWNMRLVGHDGLQGRSAYQPVIHRQGSRWLTYIGHHGGTARNPLTGQVEPNGTSIVDVTEPQTPHYVHHLPGRSDGAQMVRVCSGRDLPKADPDKTYLLRTLGNAAHEVWDVTVPTQPVRLSTVLDGLQGTHKNWWECTSGIAYLVADGRPSGWRTSRMTKIVDLSDPTRPRFIRDFGLVGQEPGAVGEPVPEGVHGPIAFRDRVYFAYGTSRHGVLQIVDRARLLTGNSRLAEPFAPTPENLRYPEIGRLDMPPAWGGHTAFPVLGVPIPDFAPNTQGRVGDFVVLISEAIANECREFRHLTFLVDITTPATPFPVANFQVPEANGSFCTRGGRFGPHASHESFTLLYYGRLIFIAYFNAGVRAVDIRDPFRPHEVAYFIPATTEHTDKRCVRVDGAERCKAAIQTNNVEVDERGFIYLVDRASTGLHIVELTGTARAIANWP
jgi:hypothetical protein